ncbi:MAG: hypothetical protein CVU84_15105 [Firmicutes bacterium HGW-Firmicutes-1]|jgi:hypothetical protein|nr:MAG: hypothetical protein CVU84_15105 [Firmicutes bacterium HGW-Firmicutes-1]
MNKKLFYIKTIHTIIWLFFVFVIGYILYASITNKMDVLLFVAIGLVVLELIVLIIFKWRCPLTIMGNKYTNNTEIGFDIFLPKWLAKNNKTIFGIIFMIGLLITLYRLFIG